MEDELVLNPAVFTPAPEYTAKLNLVRDTILDLAAGSDNFAIMDADKGVQILMTIKTTAPVAHKQGE